MSDQTGGQPGLSSEALREVISGLRASPKTLPAKLFYDARGSELFERICELPEYYVTRTELALLEQKGHEMAARVGPGVVLLELGTGSGLKTRLLLDRLVSPRAYVAVDLAAAALEAASRELAAHLPSVAVVPLMADFSQPFTLPAELAGERVVVFFPGSTIGNFSLEEARVLFSRMSTQAEGLLLGFDLKKDPARLHSAYNDSAGVTAAFNLNLLARLNREAAANFDLDRFFHYAPYNPHAGRVEMYLVSSCVQRVEVGGESFDFAEGEAICTEWSAKYTVEQMAALAAAGGWRLGETWQDEEKMFAVGYFENTLG